jgi:hypothetical protein
MAVTQKRSNVNTTMRVASLSAFGFRAVRRRRAVLVVLNLMRARKGARTFWRVVSCSVAVEEFVVVVVVVPKSDG